MRDTFVTAMIGLSISLGGIFALAGMASDWTIEQMVSAAVLALAPAMIGLCLYDCDAVNKFWNEE